MEEYGSKLSETDKSAIESVLSQVDEAVKGDDKAKIDAAKEELAKASQKLGEIMYAQQQAGAASAEAGAQQQPDNSSTSSNDGNDVVDADFEEVNKDKK